jgi:phosphoribosylaminoimidazole-succinocarboxamide synthase
MMGWGIFSFSNRYSVFDWGEMPDHIKNKGASLCVMSAYFFELLTKRGIPNHYMGVRTSELEYVHISSSQQPTTEMLIDLVRVIKPVPKEVVDKGTVYDYGDIANMHGNFVIPLEIIYRNSLPKGSSVFKRLENGEITLEELGLTENPVPGQRLPNPIIEASTKYEAFDRYPGWPELQRLTRLSDRELKEMKEMALAANEVITQTMQAAGFVNEDGKFEFAFDPDRNLMIVDTVGTLDECRFAYDGKVEDYRGKELSKQIPRDWYIYSQPEWKKAIDAAKAQKRPDWKTLVAVQPRPLPPALLQILENLYPAVANRVIERGVTEGELFSGIPSVEEVVHEYEKFKELGMRQ